MQIDWTNGERRILGQSFADMCNRNGLDIQETLESVFLAETGRAKVITDDYIKNLRRGIGSIADARLIYGWIVKHHPHDQKLIDKAMRRLRRDIEAEPENYYRREWGWSYRWMKLIAEAEPDGSIDVISVYSDDPQPEFVSENEKVGFKINSPLDGYLIALHRGREENWHPLNLGGWDFAARVTSDIRHVPFEQRTGKPKDVGGFPEQGFVPFAFILMSLPKYREHCQLFEGPFSKLSPENPVDCDTLDKLHSLISEKTSSCRFFTSYLFVRTEEYSSGLFARSGALATNGSGNRKSPGYYEPIYRRSVL
ncbi:MAG: hypothetical protein KDJ29_21210 [Hyphomicrobiales bacterium]|nr:hypothetical protein [Hyphomicrobiales bacterium]